MVAQGSGKEVTLFAWLLFLSVTGSLVFSGLSVWMDEMVEKKSTTSLKANLISKVGKSKPMNFESSEYLNELKRCEEGIDSSVYIVQTLFFMISWHIPYLIFMGIYLYSINPLYILFFAILAVGILVMQFVKTKYYINLSKEVGENLRKMDYFSECIIDRASAKEVKLNELQTFFQKLFKDEAEIYYDKQKKCNLRGNKNDIICQGITVCMYLLILCMLGYGIINDMITVGIFASIIASIDRMITMIRSLLISNLGYVIKNLGGVYHYIQFMQEPDPPCKSVHALDNDIYFENISFRYSDSLPWVIRNVNLSIETGKTIVIVGENGAGKSTITKILLGLYQPQQGKIRVGERNMECYRFEDSTAVFQDFSKYKLTLNDNIAISTPSTPHSIDDQELFGPHATLETRKDGLVKQLHFEEYFPFPGQTYLAPEFGGIELSGGAWQRIAMLRGINRQYSLLVLDEPTAAIDPKEESSLMESFKLMTKGKTATIVSHRLGIAKIADKVLVMKKGNIVGYGTHEDLLKANSEYQRLWKAQAQFYI